MIISSNSNARTYLNPRACLVILATLVLFLASSPYALAQQSNFKNANTGYLGTGKEIYKMFIFGDDFAGGLWSGTERMTKTNTRLKVSGRYREGSGLARIKTYNWITRLPRIIKDREIDIAVIFIGNNDARDIRIGNQYLVFNAPEWHEAYAKRVASMMKLFTDKRIAVYWLGTPPVASPKLDSKLKVVAKIFREQAAKAGVRFIDIRKHFTTADGRFTKTGASINGNVVRLRSHNGVRFIKAGNNKLATLVLDQINKDIAIADGELAVENFPAPAGAKIAIDTNQRYLGPAFSMPSSQGFAIIVKPLDMPDPNAPQIATAITQGSGSDSSQNNAKTTGFSNSLAMSRLKNSVKPGSAAQKLFINGIWPKPVANRVDDFSDTDN